MISVVLRCDVCGKTVIRKDAKWYSENIRQAIPFGWYLNVVTWELKCDRCKE
jgi:phage FluMu protein Com